MKEKHFTAPVKLVWDDTGFCAVEIQDRIVPYWGRILVRVHSGEIVARVGPLPRWDLQETFTAYPNAIKWVEGQLIKRLGLREN